MSVSRSPAPWRARPRIRRGILTISALVLTITPLVATETPAQAHAVLERTSPAKDAILPAAPTEIVLTFDEPPQQLGSAVQVTGPSGVVSQGTPTLSGTEIHQALSPTLPNGAYQVAWRVVSDDGHPVAGTFAFTIRAATTPTSATPTGPTTGTPDSATPAAATTQEASNPWPWMVVAVALLALIGLSIWRFSRHDKEAA
jgi:methionine-rich copper-binding protein CopC